MTEREARDKWCPQYQVAQLFNDTRDNRGYFVTTRLGGCLASGCMMWRWEISPAQANEINAKGNAGAVPKGYCGLAK